VTTITRGILNIGLHINGVMPAIGERNAIFRAVAYIGNVGGAVTGLDLAQSSTEPTLVVTLRGALDEAQLNRLCGHLYQDAIAQLVISFDPDDVSPAGDVKSRGMLVGPKAAEWGGRFDPTQFRVPGGAILSETSDFNPEEIDL